MMDKIKALQAVYDDEINFTISTFWDGGFTAKIGDEINKFTDEANFDTAVEAVDWIVEKAKEIVAPYNKGLKAVFTHLWVKGFGWENTAYTVTDFLSVRQIGADIPLESIFIATDKSGTEYLLKGRYE